jgi:hypothetical protein
VGQQLADERAVVGGLEDLVGRAVDAADQRRLGDAERRVDPLVLEDQVDALEAERLREPLPQQVGCAPRGRHGDQVDPLGRQVRTPAVEDLGHLLDAPEPRRDAAVAGGVRDPREEPGVAHPAAVLDVLLPLGRDLPDQVAHREHEVHLDAAAVALVPQRLERSPDLRARGTGEDLVADDRGAAAPLADLGGEPVPRPDGLALEAAPRQPHQVEGGQEVRVEPVAG